MMNYMASLKLLLVVNAVWSAGRALATVQDDLHSEHRDDFIGTYTLVREDVRNRSRLNTVCEIKNDQVFVEEKDWGAWVAKNATGMTITPADPKHGEVKISRRQGGLVGQEQRETGVVKWSMVRVHVVSKWLHQAGNQRPMEMPLWSTGRAFKADGRIKCKVNPAKNELILECPETTDRCK